MLRRMSEIPTPADYVAGEIAGKAVGIAARTLRYWLSTGKRAAIAGKRGKLVSMAEVEQMARMVGKSGGNPTRDDGNPAMSAAEPAGNVAEPLAESLLVSDAARLQLATIRDEWPPPSCLEPPLIPRHRPDDGVYWSPGLLACP